MKGAMAVVGVVAFAVGAVVGVSAVYSRLGEARAERDALASQCGDMQTKIGNLERARDEALARAQRALARADDFAERAAEEPEVAEAALELMEPEEEAPPAIEETEETDDGRRGRGWRGDDGDGEGRTVPLDQALRRAEMRERFEGMREATFLALDDAIAKSSDPAEQQRLAALAETTATLMELFGQMRNAQTDEERDVLRAAIGEAHQSQHALVAEQQDYQTRKVLSTYGISSAQKQDEFMAAMEQMRNDSVLSSPMLRWGGGDRGRGPGR